MELLKARFEKHLQDGETIVWTGAPDKDLGWRPEEIGEYLCVGGMCLLIGIGPLLPFFSCLINGHGKGLAIMAVFSFGFCGLITSVIGLSFLYTESIARKCVAYAITNRRVLELWSSPAIDAQSIMSLVCPGKAFKLMEMSLEAVCQTELTQNPDGTGTLQFTAHRTPNSAKPVAPLLVMKAADPRKRDYPMFVLIPAADRAARILQERLRSAELV